MQRSIDDQSPCLRCIGKQYLVSTQGKLCTGQRAVTAPLHTAGRIQRQRTTRGEAGTGSKLQLTGNSTHRSATDEYLGRVGGCQHHSAT